jgi:hypothetical protein
MPSPLARVQGPDYTPLQYGLWSVVQDRSATADRWRSGVVWQPICGTAVTTYDECLTVTGTGGPPPPPAAKAATHTLAARGAQPFTVVAQVDCSPVGYVNDPDERTNARNAARVALTQTELIQVEAAFWTGVAGGRNVVLPHLAANAAFTNSDRILMQTAATTVTGSTVLDIVEAMGYLESRLNACYGGQGTIHVPEILYPALVNSYQLVQVGGVNGPQLRTWKGNLVAIGAGYPGTGPDGTITPNAAWIYGTGPVFGYRGMEPGPDSELTDQYRISDWLDRSENTMKVQAERTYLLGFDCCHFSVNVSLGGIVTGQPLSAF